MSLVNRSRRLGARHAAPGLVLSWNTGGRRSPRRWHRPFEEADLIDLSVTGAQFLAPDNGRIVVGYKVSIVLDSALGEVRVKRIVPLSNGQLAMYGVEFIALEPALEALLFPRIPTSVPTPESIVWH